MKSSPKLFPRLLRSVSLPAVFWMTALSTARMKGATASDAPSPDITSPNIAFANGSFSACAAVSAPLLSSTILSLSGLMGLTEKKTDTEAIKKVVRASSFRRYKRHKYRLVSISKQLS